MRAGRCFLIAVVGAGACADASWAQGTAPPAPAGAGGAQPPAKDEGGVHFGVSLRSELGLNAEFDAADSPGDLTTNRAGADLEAFIPVGERGLLTLGLGYEFSSYDFSGATGFIAGTGDPWGDVQRGTLSARFGRQESDRWAWFVGGQAMAHGEDGADFDSSINVAGFGGASYTAGKDFTLGLGIGVSTQLEKSALVVPLFVLDWKFADHWRLSNNRLPGLTLSYEPSDAWTFSLGGQWEIRDFRLRSDGPLPGGAAEETRVPVVLGVEYRPDERLTLRAGVGASFLNSWELRDDGGDTVSDVDGDPSVFLRLSVRLMF